jgi:uncharacterized BrkB/YihY/UPF0761 family membrane protein
MVQYGIKVAWLPLVIFKLAAIPVTVASLWMVYCLVPNRRVPVRRVFPIALLVGIGLEIWKYIFLIAWPWLDRKFTNEYGPFSYSASIIIFSVLTALLVLAGAEWSARKPLFVEDRERLARAAAPTDV